MVANHDWEFFILDRFYGIFVFRNEVKFICGCFWYFALKIKEFNMAIEIWRQKHGDRNMTIEIWRQKYDDRLRGDSYSRAY